MNLRAILDLVRMTYRRYQANHGPRLAASLAFYSAISIAPLLAALAALLSTAMGRDAAERELLAQVTSLAGPHIAEFVGQVIVSRSVEPAVSGVAQLAKVLVLLWGSANVFLELQDTLNLIWNVQPAKGRPLFRMLGKRLFGFGLVLAMGFLILVSLAFNAAISLLLERTGRLGPDVAWLWRLVNLSFTLFGSAFLFALLYKSVPDADVSWRVAWLGAGVTGVLFTLGTVALKALLGGQGAPYGVTGSLIVFLLWVYYSAQIVFFGAELTQVYTERISAAIEPALVAEPTS